MLIDDRVTIASTVRMVLLIQGFFYPQPTDDPTYNIGFVISAIETNLAIITASVPALKPLFKRWFPSIFGAASDPYDSIRANQATKQSRTASSKTNIGMRSMHDNFLLNNMKARTDVHSEKSSSQDVIMPDREGGIVKIVDVSVNYRASTAVHGNKMVEGERDDDFEMRGSEESTY
jgi:hypothetical protein